MTDENKGTTPETRGRDSGPPLADDAPASLANVNAETGAPVTKEEPVFTEDGEVEEAVGNTEVGKCCSEALVALGRAARSFLLYEADNKAITKFLEDLRAKIHMYLSRYGDMVLTVRPWEMALGREVVYVNRDRERSLAFRLFRDGVRKVTLGKSMAWEELSKFLGIISIRYKGIRQQEDDVVTLLWKAGFKNITIVAVEGFIPEDEDYIDQQDRGMLVRGIFHDGSRAFDQPAPELAERGPLSHVAVDPARLSELTAETTNLALPNQAVSLLREVLQTASDPAEPLTLEEARTTIDEIRDFLLSEGLLTHLLSVLKLLKELHFRTEDEELQETLIGAFSDAKALSRIIRSVPPGLRELPTDLIDLVSAIPGDRVQLLIDILGQERSRHARWAVRSLLAHFAADSLDYLVELVGLLDGPAPGDLLLVVADLNMAKAFEVAMTIDVDAEHELLSTAMGIIERNAYSREVALKLSQFLESQHADIRSRSLKVLVSKRERWVFMAIIQRLERHHTSGIEPHEIEELATAMVQIWQTRALDQFQRWIKPKGLFRRVIQGQVNLKWAAVHGLAMIPDKSAAKYIQMVIKDSSGQLASYAEECLTRQRSLTGGAGNG